MSEETRIILRACFVEMDESDGFAGVMLPDGRILIWESTNRVSSYRDQAALTSKHPDAKLYMHPDADEALNS